MINTFLNELRAQGKSDLTIRQYRSTWNRFTRYIDEFKPLSQGTGMEDSAYLTGTTPKDIADFRYWMEQSYKPNTVLQTLTQLNKIFKYFTNEKMIIDNPVEQTDTKVIVQLEAPKWLTQREQNTLIRATREQYAIASQKGEASRVQAIKEATILIVLLHTGLRVSELCNLKHDDLEIKERGGKVTVRGKGRKMRVVPLNLDARRALNRYYENHTPKGVYVFDSRRSEKLTTRAVEKMCEKYTKITGLKHLTPHVLRHTFIHELMQHPGIKENMVAQLAGHMKSNGLPNVAMTYRYAMPSGDELQQAVEKLSWIKKS